MAIVSGLTMRWNFSQSTKSASVWRFRSRRKVETRSGNGRLQAASM
jgi:hypothetical protein